MSQREWWDENNKTQKDPYGKPLPAMKKKRGVTVYSNHKTWATNPTVTSDSQQLTNGTANGTANGNWANGLNQISSIWASTNSPAIPSGGWVVPSTIWGSIQKTYYQPNTYQIGWDAAGVFSIMENGIKMAKTEDKEFKYSLEGYFQGKHYRVNEISLNESPIEAVIKMVLELGEGEEVLSFLKKNADGSTEIVNVEAS